MNKILITPVNAEYAISLAKLGLRSISYSLISKANSEMDLVNYVLRKDIACINLEYGKQAHAVLSNESYKTKMDTKSYVDTTANVAYLSYHQVSESILMKMALNHHNIYTQKHNNQLEHEKKIFVILEYRGYKFLVKAYIDAFNAALNTILEFKTTSTMFNIFKVIDKYNYDLQAYIYCLIIESHYIHMPEFEFFFLNKKNQEEIMYIRARNALLSSGKKKLETYLPKVIHILYKYKYLDMFKI